VVEAIERRAAWLGITVGIVLAFDASGSVAYSFGGIGTWELVIFIGGLVCLAGAGALVVAALAPPSMRPLALEQRERLVFFALVLLALALIAIVTLSGHAAIEAHRHPQS
jgi:hypothetical protein